MIQTERQKEITKTALSLIASKGIQGLTIKNLSKAIGISEPAIYRHFESKTEILLSLLTQFTEMAEMLSVIIGNLKGTATEKIEFLFARMMEIFLEMPSIVSVIFSEEIFKNEESLKQKITQVMNMHATTIEQIIIEGQKKNEIRNDIEPGTLTLIIMGSLRLLVKRWDLSNKNFDLNGEGDKLIKGINKMLT